jgi:hypothetical protein
MNKVLRVIAITIALLVTSSVATFADGNPMPICNEKGCTGPL